MTVSQLISTVCDLQVGCGSTHFEYIFFTLYKVKRSVMITRKEKLRLTY